MVLKGSRQEICEEARDKPIKHFCRTYIHLLYEDMNQLGFVLAKSFVPATTEAIFTTCQFSVRSGTRETVQT